MKSVAEYVKEQLTGAFFVLSRSNLGASSDEELAACMPSLSSVSVSAFARRS